MRDERKQITWDNLQEGDVVIPIVKKVYKDNLTNI